MLLTFGLALAFAALALVVGVLKHTRDVQNEARLASMPPRPASRDDQVWTPDTQAWELLQYDDRDHPRE